MVAVPSADVGSAGDTKSLGMEALERLGATSPPRYLASSPDLARLARDAAAHLFSSLVPFAPKPLPLDRLLASESFDAEQIWQQIDVQSRPLTRVLRRELSRFEKMEDRELEELFGVRKGMAPEGTEDGEEEHEEKGTEEDREEEDDEDDDEEGDEDVGTEEDDDEKDMEDDGEEEDKAELPESGGLNDGFFNTKELEKFMVEDEEREFRGKVKTAPEEDDEEDDDDDQIDGGGADDFAANARYEDFFEKKKDIRSRKGNRKKTTKNSRDLDEDDEWNMQDRSGDESEHSDEDDINNGEKNDNEADGILSTFERELKKNQSKIEQIEKELLAPPSWTMQGEITASKRPKNSALEVDLDFQHNKVQPADSTEENTASIEDLIIKRIRDGQFDDVQRLATLPTKEPKEPKQLDDNKSQKGLAEIYEEEYAQKAGISNASLSLTDEQKKQANVLFKKLCLKLDALSHFHFTPKPVIEDMAIQSNVPALAMEEIAPLAVSDASMLAPEEIFTGKGDIKEEAELTQADRKRRRAKKKRKFKAESVKRASKKARQLMDTSVRA